MKRIVDAIKAVCGEIICKHDWRRCLGGNMKDPWNAYFECKKCGKRKTYQNVGIMKIRKEKKLEIYR